MCVLDAIVALHLSIPHFLFSLSFWSCTHWFSLVFVSLYGKMRFIYWMLRHTMLSSYHVIKTRAQNHFFFIVVPKTIELIHIRNITMKTVLLLVFFLFFFYYYSSFSLLFSFKMNFWKFPLNKYNSLYSKVSFFRVCLNQFYTWRTFYSMAGILFIVSFQQKKNKILLIRQFCIVRLFCHKHIVLQMAHIHTILHTTSAHIII